MPRLERHPSTLDTPFGDGQRVRSVSRWRAVRSRHSSEQYLRFTGAAGSILTSHVGHLRSPDGSTPPAARNVHIHEHRLAVGGRPAGITSPQYVHRRGCCQCVAPVRVIVPTIHLRDVIEPADRVAVARAQSRTLPDAASIATRAGWTVGGSSHGSPIGRLMRGRRVVTNVSAIRRLNVATTA